MHSLFIFFARKAQYKKKPRQVIKPFTLTDKQFDGAGELTVHYGQNCSCCNSFLFGAI